MISFGTNTGTREHHACNPAACKWCNPAVSVHGLKVAIGARRQGIDPTLEDPYLEGFDDALCWVLDLLREEAP